jgi:hypothetical protein
MRYDTSSQAHSFAVGRLAHVTQFATPANLQSRQGT